MSIGVVVSNAAVAQPTHTTVHLVEAALAAGHAVRVIEPWDFEIDPRGRLTARAHALDGPLDREQIVAALRARAALRRSVEVDRLSLLMLRANPLQDAIVTYGQLAAAAGVRVVNDPFGMLRTSHKGYLASLPDVPRPLTLVTRSASAAERFAAGCESGVVVKPARSCGGRGVTLVRGRRALARIAEAVQQAGTSSGDGYAVVQEYLPAASAGEKRLLWLDGALIGGYLRMRAPGEFRHNLKVGGVPTPCELTERDRELSASLTPHLRRDGVWFAGIDVIGGLVVEVNTLNPGGAHYTTTFTGLPVAERIIQSLLPPLASTPLHPAQSAS